MATHTMEQARAAVDGEWGERIVRVGWVAKAAVYALVALLAYRLATGTPNEEASPTGAVRYLAEQPLGSAMLLALAVGLVAYAAGRLLRATVLAGDASPLRRLGYAGTGLAYLGLAALAAGVAFGVGAAESGGGSGQPSEATSTAFSLPAGRWLVAAAGLGFVVYGLTQAYLGLSRGYTESLRTHEMGPTTRQWVDTACVVGLVGHGAALGLVGSFLVRAAVTYDPSEAVGLDGALQRLAVQPWGTAMLLAAAIGLAGYAAYCGVLARYQRVP